MAKFVHVVSRTPKANRKVGTYGKVVFKSLNGNSNFTAVNLTVLSARLLVLDKAETAAANREPGAASALAAARESVRQEVDHLRDFVQGTLETQVGTVDLKALKAMAESAAMDLRKVTARAKAVFDVLYGPVAGSVRLTAPASRQRDTHEWQHSGDQITWTALPSTRQARTTVSGLPVGAALHFRHRLLTKTGYTQWSDPTVMIVVK